MAKRVVKIGTADLKGQIAEMTGTPGALLSDTGTIAFSDADVADIHTISVVGFQAASSNVTSALGTLTAIRTSDTANGTGGLLTWAYTVSASAVEYLAAGQKRTEAFDVMIDDGHGGAVIKTVVVTVTGTNDVPVVAAADLDGAVTEISGKPVRHTVLTDGGTIAFSDVDLADTHTVSVARVGTTLGRVSASIAADTADGTGGSVAWTYKVAASRLEYLAEGEQRIETFDVTVKDRHGGALTQTVTVVLTGTNDGPTLANVDLKGAVTETLGAPAPGAQLSDHGTVAFSDVDLADTHTVAVAGFNAGASGTATSALGTLTASLVADTVNGTGGVLSWTYTVDAAAVEYLAAGEIRIEAFDVVVADGHGGTTTKTVVVTITGTADTLTANHAPVVSGAVAGTAVEDGVPLTLDALANASDVDANTILSVVNVPASLPAGVSYDAATHSFTLDPSNAAFSTWRRMPAPLSR